MNSAYLREVATIERAGRDDIGGARLRICCASPGAVTAPVENPTSDDENAAADTPHIRQNQQKKALDFYVQGLRQWVS